MAYTVTGRIESCRLIEPGTDGPLFLIRVELDDECWRNGSRIIELRTEHGTLPGIDRFHPWCSTAQRIMNFFAVGKSIEFKMSAVRRRVRREGDYQLHHRATDFQNIRPKCIS